MTRAMRLEIASALFGHPALPPYSSARRLTQLLAAQRRKCAALARSSGPHRVSRLRLACEQRDVLIKRIAQVRAAERLAVTP